MFKIRPLKRTFILLITLVAMLTILILYQDDLTPTPNPAHSPERQLPKVDLTLALPDNYVFRQDNPKWSTRKLGETNDILSEYGCTVTSVAMAASNLLKTEITPADLNARLTKSNGYTKTGLLIWQHISTATNGKLQAITNTVPSHAAIDQCMQGDGYPIIKIDIGKGVNHWAIIVGKSDEDYYIRDPRIGKANDTPIPLSNRSDHIYATRCVSLNVD